MSERTVFILHRASGGLLAPFVVIHLLGILLAVGGGLTADEILGRTQGSICWAAFYMLFALLASIHGSIGMRNVLRDWTPWRGRWLDTAMLALAAVLFITGLRAVVAVVG